MKKKLLPMALTFLGAWCLASAAPVRAEKPAAASKPAANKAADQFIRLTRNARNQPAALETAIVHYVPADGKGGVSVDLIGAVHVGDRSYYEKLNKQFKTYDVVLYELVAPQGTRIP